MTYKHLANMCHFQDADQRVTFEKELDRIIEAARNDGILQGLWESSLLIEEIEAKRGCKSILAEKISRYRTTMQLRLEKGPYYAVEA